MSPLRAGYRPTDIPETRRAEMLAVDTWAFPTTVSDEQMLEMPSSLTWERTRGVETDDGELVACHSSYPYSAFPVPGTTTAVSGLTWVGVHPAHRRRGLLRSMIDDHFSRSLARGEAVSALFAAEPAIYGRFGYGLAAFDLRLTVPRGAELRDVEGADALRVRLERLDPETHGPAIQRVHAAVDRPGWATRQTPELLAAFLSDPEPFREGRESLRIALVERDGDPVGYALFRRKSVWEATGPRGTVYVREVVTPDGATSRALWGVLLDLDLMATVESWLMPVDDPLLHLLVDPRATEPKISDNLWVRLLDVPVALAARRYRAPVDVVLDVTDGLLPANQGRWRLVGGPDGATVERVDGDATADLRLDVRELGAAYLGGTTLAGLAGAGLVTELNPGSVDRASLAFGWHQPPVCSWIW
ncbi:MAG TPA: GNAT family N-acetyltransferase [Actinotalea sp.]